MLAGPGDERAVREELLRFSREIAFAAARVYASAAETRGVVGRPARGAGDRRPGARRRTSATRCRASSPRWAGATTGPVAAVVGDARPTGAARGRAGRRCTAPPAGSAWTRWPACTAAGWSSSSAAPATRSRRPRRCCPRSATARSWSAGRRADGSPARQRVTRAALSGLRAVAGVAGRAAAGQRRRAAARAGPGRRRRRPRAAGRRPCTGRWSRPATSLLETVAAFLDTGGALEATARALFVHANTVRYRLRRVAEVCGEAPTDAARRVRRCGSRWPSAGWASADLAAGLRDPTAVGQRCIG